MSEPLQSVGDRVAHLQSLSGLDRAELSRLAGLAPSHVGAIIRGGVKDPASSTMGAIARVTGVSTDWLIRGEGDQPSEDDVHEAIERARAAARDADDLDATDPALDEGRPSMAGAA
jgi:transcriptional regulator with XRE-family HTH domain